MDSSVNARNKERPRESSREREREFKRVQEREFKRGNEPVWVPPSTKV